MTLTFDSLLSSNMVVFFVYFLYVLLIYCAQLL